MVAELVITKVTRRLASPNVLVTTDNIKAISTESVRYLDSACTLVVIHLRRVILARMSASAVGGLAQSRSNIIGPRPSHAIANVNKVRLFRPLASQPYGSFLRRPGAFLCNIPTVVYS